MKAINKTATKMRWYVIPADDKEMARYIVAKLFGKKCKHTDIKNRN
jgi:polyphosphate kinase 2 (PPK2 family)